MHVSVDVEIDSGTFEFATNPNSNSNVYRFDGDELAALVDGTHTKIFPQGEPCTTVAPSANPFGTGTFVFDEDVDVEREFRVYPGLCSGTYTGGHTIAFGVYIRHLYNPGAQLDVRVGDATPAFAGGVGWIPRGASWLLDMQCGADPPLEFPYSNTKDLALGPNDAGQDACSWPRTYGTATLRIEIVEP